MKSLPCQVVSILCAIAIALPSTTAAQRGCAADSARSTLGYHLINEVLLDEASRLPDTLETGWLDAFDVPIDSGAVEVARRWEKMWRALINNCASIPDSIRAQFARRIDVTAIQPDANIASIHHYYVRDLSLVDTLMLTARVGTPDGSRKYIFGRDQGQWKIVDLPVTYPSCPPAERKRQISGVLLERSTHAPIAGGQILVSNTECGAISDANGRWILRGAPPTRFLLKTGFIGYKTLRVDIPASRRDTTGILIELEEAIPYLEF